MIELKIELILLIFTTRTVCLYFLMSFTENRKTLFKIIVYTLSIKLLFECPIISRETLDRFASNFNWGNR